jgi:hypothetical protein
MDFQNAFFVGGRYGVVLEVHLPKSEATKPKKVKVSAN